MAENEIENKTLFEDQNAPNATHTEKESKKSKKGKKPQRHFPTFTLEEALEVPNENQRIQCRESMGYR